MKFCGIVFQILLLYIRASFLDNRYDRPRRIDLFNYLISTSTTPAPQKCQCVSQTSNSSCVPYDSRLQATNLEEAIVAFPDLTITQQEKSSTLSETSNLMSCKTKQCKSCYKLLKAQLAKVGLLPATIKQVFENQSNFSKCEKYRFSRKDQGVYEKKNKAKHYDWDDDEDYETDYDPFDMNKGNKFRRKIRDVSETTTVSPNSTAMNITGVIGVRFPIACTTRGVTPDGLNTVSLCSTCWVWRRLPSNYYPAYLNEVVCDNADQGCLSGYATCHTGTQQLNVLRNDSGTLVPVSVAAGINCECRVQVGSVLQSLVMGNGTTSALPSLNSTNSGN
ncbi:unnamed protein product [Caenorhabditis angaria]|uniref:Uncharacterized protein n=1 Tax=Caenorhabditis angaria TaxID=860376 RepID=A0A9P1IY32_9PELO|nr:unnamed protein product [Caenorhabditis angaria]